MDKTLKQINEVFEGYFELIDDFFGSIKHYLGEEEYSHIELGERISTYPLISDLVVDAIDDLDNEVNDFWEHNAKTVIDFVKNRSTLKCLYSGDVTPVILEDFVKRSALYIDTVIIPDPLFNLAVIQKQMFTDKKYYINKLIRHVFNIWKLKELILAELKEKALIILPISLHIIRPETRKILIEKANERFEEYINEVFNQHLDSRETIQDFLRQFRTTEEMFKAIKRAELFPNTFKKPEDFEEFFIDFASNSKYSIQKDESLGVNFDLYFYSQFIRVQEHKFFCEQLIAEPIYDYDLPWFFFNYEMGGLDMDAAIANALQRERFNWISKVPLQALKVLREDDDLNYMRNVLRNGITDLKAKYDKDLSAICSQIEENFLEAFNKQDSELKLLRAKVAKITKKEIPLTTGGYLAGFIPYLGFVLSLITAGSDMKKLLLEREALIVDVDKKENQYINLLMKSYETE